MMSKSAQDFVSAAYIRLNQTKQPHSASIIGHYLSDECERLDHCNEELQKALNQARADRDYNEEVLIRLRTEKSKLFFELKDAETQIARLAESAEKARPRGNLCHNPPTMEDAGKWFWLTWPSAIGGTRELGQIVYVEEIGYFAFLGTSSKGNRSLGTLWEECTNIKWYGPVAAPPDAVCDAV